MNFRHGKSSTPEYRIWLRMLHRCQNPKSASWKYYGGRGIQVRFASFEQFFAEVGLRPSTKMSIDRIKNDGHYEPGNVRWATAAQQSQNRRRHWEWSQLKTFCKRGHELTPENVYIMANGYRSCKKCSAGRSLVRTKAAYAMNPEKFRERNRRWKAANPEKARESSRKSYRRIYPKKQAENLAKAKAWQEEQTAAFLKKVLGPT